MKDIYKLYEEVIEEEKKIIINGDEHISKIIILSKGGKIEVFNMAFQDAGEKKLIRDAVKEMIIKRKIIGYIFIADCKATIGNFDDKKQVIVKDALMCVLYTPTDKVTRGYFYSNKVFEKDVLEYNGRDKSRDEWDLWNTEEANLNLMEKYSGFRTENAHLYNEIKHVSIQDILSEKQIRIVHKYINDDNWDMLRSYLNKQKKQLERKGIYPDYLYYYLKGQFKS